MFNHVKVGFGTYVLALTNNIVVQIFGENVKNKHKHRRPRTHGRCPNNKSYSTSERKKRQLLHIARAFQFRPTIHCMA